MSARTGIALAAALLATLAAAAARAVELEADLLLESDTAWRLRSPRTLQKSQNRAELDASLRFSPDLRLRGIGRVLWDPAGKLIGSDPDFGQRPLDRWQVGGSRTLEAELRELYVEGGLHVAGQRVDLRLGKQQVVWGQSFGLRVLDLVNAQDFREFILDEFVDARTPVWGLRADALVGETSLQALLFPDFEPDVLPDPESEFALDPALRGLLPGLVPAAPGQAPLVLLDLAPDSPGDWDPASWGWGLRAGRMLHGVDLALYYWDRIDPRGAFARSASALAAPGGPSLVVNQLQRDFARVRTLGFSFSTALGDFTLWGEGGVSTGRPYVVEDLADADGVVRRSDLEYALGLDWNGWAPLFANVQLIHQLTFGDDREIALARSREFVSILLRFSLRRETLFPQIFALYGADEDDAMLRPSLEWRASDRLSFVLGADLFSGPREGLLGQYAQRRACVPVPAGLPLPGSGDCLFDAPPGRPSRVFLRLRYQLGLRRP